MVHCLSMRLSSLQLHISTTVAGWTKPVRLNHVDFIIFVEEQKLRLQQPPLMSVRMIFLSACPALYQSSYSYERLNSSLEALSLFHCVMFFKREVHNKNLRRMFTISGNEIVFHLCEILVKTTKSKRFLLPLVGHYNTPKDNGFFPRIVNLYWCL